jgi:hypothetical protein
MVSDHRDRQKRTLWGGIRDRQSVVGAHMAEAKARDLPSVAGMPIHRGKILAKVKERDT